MILEIFTFLLALSFALLLTYLVFTAICAARKAVPLVSAEASPPVTILKPMKNIDDGLEENLISFFTLDYPRYRIIFGVDGFDDACVAVIEKVKKLYPSVKADVVETGVLASVNPKIDKLAKMAEGCDSRLFWVTDSNTRVERGTLSSLVRECEKRGAKIVFSPIMGTGGGTLGSMMSNAYLNLFVSGNIIAGWAVARNPIIVGKSMLIERETLERLGGFAAFNCYLAEDYMMGEIYRENGIYISTNFTWVINFSSTTSIRTFYARMSRWAKMRLRISPFFYSLEILTNPLAIALISVVFLGEKGLPLLAAAYVFKLLIEYANLVFVNRADARRVKVLCVYPVCVLLKDAILFMVYAGSFFSKTVSWHGRKIVIGAKSRIDNIEEKAKSNEKL